MIVCFGPRSYFEAGLDEIQASSDQIARELGLGTLFALVGGLGGGRGGRGGEDFPHRSIDVLIAVLGSLLRPARDTEQFVDCAAGQA